MSGDKPPLALEDSTGFDLMVKSRAFSQIKDLHIGRRT